MNELIAMVWDTETLVTIAIVGYVLGFLFKSQITLRMLVLVASLFYIAYYYYHPAEPLWGAIWGSVLIIVANLIGLSRLLYSRLPIGIPADQWPIFKALEGLEPGEFRQLMSLGGMKFADRDVELTAEDTEVDCLYFAITGNVTGDKGGHKFRMYAGEFIGEVSFMLGGMATATVSIEKGGVYYEWRKDRLRKVLESQPRLSQAFEALIGRDMAKKVASGYRSEELKVHSADVELQDDAIGGKIVAPVSG